jgi:glycosyltransferase involved in cell wall biosynthesis
MNIRELNGFTSYLVPNPIPKKTDALSHPESPFKDHKEKTSLTFISADLNNPIKNFGLIQDSLQQMSGSELGQYRLNLVGRGDVGKLPIGLEVLKHGALAESEVSKVLSETDVLIVPSLIDNSPNVVSEGLMAGCFVVGSTAGGILERLREFGMPTLSPRDPDGFAAAIKGAAQNHKREDVSEKAQKLFGFETVARLVSDIYNS